MAEIQGGEIPTRTAMQPASSVTAVVPVKARPGWLAAGSVVAAVGAVVMALPWQPWAALGGFLLVAVGVALPMFGGGEVDAEKTAAALSAAAERAAESLRKAGVK